MHSRLPADLQATAASGTPAGDGMDSADATEVRDPRPFVERRRQRPLEHAWHDALESVHRVLVRYEDLNHSLATAEEQYRTLFDRMPVGIFRASPAGRPLLVNRWMAAICEFDSPEALCDSIFGIGDQLFVDRALWPELAQRLSAAESLAAVEAEILTLKGTRKWLQLNLSSHTDESGLVWIEGAAQEITERRAAENRLRLLAYHDPVTALPNRALLEERLAEALETALRGNRQVALLLLELSRFKMINDSLGKTLGDGLLQETAGRIRSAVGSQCTVARVSGAEFAVILEDVRNAQDVEPTARRIVEALSAEYSLFGHALAVSCTVGIGMFPADGLDSQTLLERADVAMYSAKEQDVNGFCFFSQEMNNQILERLRLENGLRLALERDELFLMYQPQVDIRTGAISGVEALLRWRHPQLGLVPPSDFIGVAESSGLIVPIGEWVLRTACSQARQWQDAGLPRVPIAVNVSAIQFRQQDFCEMVRRVLHDSGLHPRNLELELTEGLLLTNADVVFTLVQELREMGVKLTIDDFGTGYSSLGYLRQFKVNRLKIDRSFVRDVPGNVDDSAITTAIIEMARALNVDVIAEGVENVQQLNFLRGQHCYEIQGFYFSRPVAAEQMTEQLRAAFMYNA